MGVASYLRIQPDAGSIEVGHLHFSPLLQRRTAATEAQYLMMRYVFDDLGYRRYELKCDALNAPSRAAAERLGFSYDGIFRQAVVVRGRNRDTAWFSIVDAEWPRVRAGLEAWLGPANWPDGPTGRRAGRCGRWPPAGRRPTNGGLVALARLVETERAIAPDADSHPARNERKPAMNLLSLPLAFLFGYLIRP